MSFKLPPYPPLRRFSKALLQDPVLMRFLTHIQELPAQEPRFKDPDPPLPGVLSSALERMGIRSLYTHQAEALELVRKGENVVAVTPTASGKSLIFNLPILEGLIQDLSRSALFLFPLKALEQDQAQRLRRLIDWCGLSGFIDVAIYDGDTPEPERRRIRKHPPHILITNPDMLHLGIAAFHREWEEFIRRLSWIVMDELHIYRGVFGSHFLWVLHRLSRLSRYYGSHIQYIATSATISGAQELAQTLTDEEFRLIDHSGAPSPTRYFLFFNPSLQESYLKTSLRLLLLALESGLKTIVFTKARQTTERLYFWLRELEPQWANRVSSYRAGFMPEERREIERALLSGELDGVISTSALEMGIDIGGLDLCILVGYPGTVATTWQRAGRVGRGQYPAVIALVAGEDQLDQYITTNPHDFFARPVEQAIVDDTNEFIAQGHLMCAASELPLRVDEPFISQKPELTPLIEKMTREGKLLLSASGDQWFTGVSRPHRKVDIRSTGDQYAILLSGDSTIGTISGRQAFAECHPGAIYLQRGEQFLVEDLDFKGHRISVKPVQVDYYTRALSEKETEILEELKEKDLPGGKVVLARLRVREQIIGYEKRRISTQEILSSHSLELPPIIYQTVGFFLKIPGQLEKVAQEQGIHFHGGLHGAEHAMLALAPLFALCDRNDLGGYSIAFHHQVQSPTIFIYDGYPGGIGLSARLYDVVSELLSRTALLISKCPCQSGCPSCIHSPKCGHGNRPLDKKGALLVCETLLSSDSFHLQSPLIRATGALTTGDYPKPAVEPSVARPFPVLNLPPPPPSPPLPSNWPRNKRGGILDIETQKSAQEVGGWGNVADMKFGYACLYLFPEDKWLDFWEDDVTTLINTLKTLDLVVGFNIEKFDLKVLSAYTRESLEKIPIYDIIHHVFHYLHTLVSLSDLARGTLGVGKSANGMQSLEWWKKGEYQKVALYCRQDVALTRDLFYFLLEKGYLLCYKRNTGLVRLLLPSPLQYLR